jgi:spore coat polysaccharide biosynthesis predicted glycosyltransferase SpsG
VLVCFGGSDPHGVTARIGTIVAADRRWSTTIVVGPGYQGARPPGVDVRSDPSDLPDLVATADLALISAGTMKFEVAAVGCPALLIGVADDQRDVGPAFAATGAARWIGDWWSIDPAHVVAAVAESLADPGARAAMSRTARRVVDGRGGDRLAQEIAALL